MCGSSPTTRPFFLDFTPGALEELRSWSADLPTAIFKKEMGKNKPRATLCCVAYYRRQAWAAGVGKRMCLTE